MSHYSKVTIVGVGLIGGSIGLALKRRQHAAEVVGVGRRPASLDKARTIGAIDTATTDIHQGVAGADLVVVASPVDSIVEHVRQALQETLPQAVVTDAGSTKAVICAAFDADTGTGSPQFVGSHPLAGDHRTGPEHAREDLLEGKTVVMTPSATSSAQAIAKVEQFWQNLGATVVRMSATEHDEALASTSHLPHLVASALAAATPEQWLRLAATGWEDTTRVAAADPQLWSQIFSQNRQAVLATLDRFTAQIDQLKSSLDQQDWSQLETTLQNAKRIRDALGN